jgi:dienelactone hydrolase
MKKVFRQIGAGLAQVASALWPGGQAWRGAAWGVVAVYTVMLLVFAWDQAGGGWTLPTLVALMAFGLVLGGLTVALVDLLVPLVRSLLDLVIRVFPRLYRAVAVAAIIMLIMLFFSGSGPLGQGIGALLVLAVGSLLGAGIWTLSRGAWSTLTPLHRVEAVVGGALGLGLLAFSAGWYVWPGPKVAPLPVNDTAANIAPLLLEDPSQPGPYTVRTLTYGSGADLRRAEFGSEADLITVPVDGSAFIDRWEGIPGQLRTAYWGFDLTELPVNGRVWYPEGEGPFPLALIVHGNHNMLHHSDPGYAYLGDLLASRGMILVSVDQNFLNGGWMDRILIWKDSGLREENDGRGWLLLEHLVQWQRWHEAEGNPFTGKVDMDRIAVMGHSRGGEAAAIAAAFNRMGAYPGNGFRALAYDFNIRAVVAIAPVDGQYKPAGRGTSLHDVNYLTLHGAYDGDVRAFHGARQYNRVTFSPGGEGFKSAVYIDRANHGQFNSRWGRADAGSFPRAGMLNLRPMMDEADQQQIAMVLISAFLEATLKDQLGYVALFRDLRRAQDWLPEVAYLARYDDARTTYLATFEEDVDPTTATLPGATVVGESLTRWGEGIVEQKWDDQQTSAVTLGWANADAATFYAVKLEEVDQEVLGGLADSLASADARLIFSLAAGETGEEALDLTVEVLDRSGAAARLPLSHMGLLPPQPEFRTLKHPVLERQDMRWAEPVFRGYEFPFADFRVVAPDFDPTELIEVRFVFDRSANGLVLLDDVGVRW